MGLLQKVNSMCDAQDIISKFKGFKADKFPDFYSYRGPLETGLWVLWVFKDGLGIKRLTAKQIAKVIVDEMEISVDADSITKSFNRAKDKIHVHKEGGDVFYEIMKPGKGFLEAKTSGNSIFVYHFEPDRQFTSKRILSKDIFANLQGDLKIVDPYCGEKTLDILKDISNGQVKFLTRLTNLSDKDKKRFLRELQDFRLEKPSIEFRDCPYAELHDRYIISADKIVLLGHSMKDLGKKESFAVLLGKKESKNIVEAINESFDRRWKQSSLL